MLLTKNVFAICGKNFLANRQLLVRGVRRGGGGGGGSGGSPLFSN